MTQFSGAEPEPDVADTRRSAMIQSVAVAAHFLRILAEAGGPMPLRELARRPGTGSSTAHRYMRSLTREGLVMQDEQTSFYDPGPAALSIGIAALRRVDPVETAAKQIRALSSRVSASGGVAIWTERGPTIVRWYRNAHFTLGTVALGDVLPLDNTACGLVFQAFLPEEIVAAARPRRSAANPRRRAARRDPPGGRGGADGASLLLAHRQGRPGLRRPERNRLRDDHDLHGRCRPGGEPPRHPLRGGPPCHAGSRSISGGSGALTALTAPAGPGIQASPRWSRRVRPA